MNARAWVYYINDLSLNRDPMKQNRNSVFPCEKMRLTSTSLLKENLVSNLLNNCAKINVWLHVIFQFHINLARKEELPSKQA